MKNSCLLLFIFTILISCKKDTEKTESVSVPDITIQKTDTIVKKESTALKSVYDADTIALESILINNHKMLLSIDEFNTIYKNTIDSTKSEFWECGNPFEWLDEQWMKKTYGKEMENYDGEITTIYSKGNQFSSNTHLVLLDQTLMKHNALKIISYDILLDQNTTWEAFKKMFPKAESLRKNLASDEFKVLIPFLRSTYSDSLLEFHFKNGKLNSFIIWWNMC
ncbi:hypothetical protein [Flavobacterium cerinum]|uniref:Lipoprotein n=1 Tax=Flavobacterium cerinum TaxID=2502784 RepID=A0ABY5IPJ6_9FLAO|nr:hypothetical protein [Flavobacterium cerinum]UUC44564.1 hypothetical protein NOX80_13090 [Flavobacterium cerinum]